MLQNNGNISCVQYGVVESGDINVILSCNLVLDDGMHDEKH